MNVITALQETLGICRVNYSSISLAVYRLNYKALWNNIKTYYMASSVSGQDESNLELWLATWAGK